MNTKRAHIRATANEENDTIIHSITVDPLDHSWTGWKCSQIIQNRDGTSTVVVDHMTYFGLADHLKVRVDENPHYLGTKFVEHGLSIPPVRRSYPLQILKVLKLAK